jgi:DNA invertase Pin-like site-specific DNA recombinase
VTTRSKPQLDAREYLRVSLDKSGRERSNEEQHDQNLAGFPTWKFGQPYSDTGSASRHATKQRDAFAVLIDDLAHDRFGAAHLVLWESSRGSRKVGEWVELIELCEQRQVRIAVTTHGPRVYDPANPRDRRALLEDAVDSEYESAKVSLRARRAAAANAADGKPHGPVPFGYRRVYDPNSGKLLGQELHPDEAPVLREAFRRIASGNSLRRVASDLAQRGVVGRRGRPITAATLRPMLLCDTYVGLRAHAPGITGTRGRAARQRHTAEVGLQEATWEPLIDRETFLAVRTRLLDPGRRTSRPGRGVHLLSMIARCDVCGSVLAATFRSGGGTAQRQTGRTYQCHRKGCVRVNADQLDQLVEDAIIELLADPDNFDRAFGGNEGDDEALAGARGEVAEIRGELDDLADRLGRGELSAAMVSRAEPAILMRLADAQRRVDELSTPSEVRGLLAPGADVADRWSAAPMPVRRSVARLLLVPGTLGELRVRRGQFLTAAERVGDWPERR